MATNRQEMTTRQRKINTAAWAAFRTIASEAEMNGEAIHQATSQRVRRAIEDIASARGEDWPRRDVTAAVRVVEQRADVDRGWWA